MITMMTMTIILISSLAETEGNVKAVFLWNASIKLFHSGHTPAHHIHTHNENDKNDDDDDDDENENYDDEVNEVLALWYKVNHSILLLIIN